MRPGSKDKRYYILITGQELTELKKYTVSMCEAYGLDRKIEKYQGKRPIGFWRWDLDCLEAVLDGAEKEYADKESKACQAIKHLTDRIHALWKQSYLK